MKKTYASITLNTIFIPMVFVHFISNLDSGSMQTLQETLDALAEGAGEPKYPKDFPWQTARIVIYYHGLEERPAEFELRLPDGRDARVVNINPEYSEHLPPTRRAFVALMEVARQALLHGETVQEACAKTWDAYKAYPDRAEGEVARAQLESDLCIWEEMMIGEGYIPAK